MATWSRVLDPGFELVLPQDAETQAVLARSPWLQPWAVTPALELRLASSAVVVRTATSTVVVDPFLAFPGDADQQLDALRTAGVEPEDVDVVVRTHVDGAGLLAFPRARHLVPAAALAEVRAGRHEGAEALLDGAEPVTGAGPVVDDVALVDLPGHADGHLGVAIGDPVAAIVCGHLFVHPAQVANPATPGLDEDTATATATRLALLARCADEGIVLVGPLWAEPGAAVVVRDGDGFALAPG